MWQSWSGEETFEVERLIVFRFKKKVNKMILMLILSLSFKLITSVIVTDNTLFDEFIFYG